MNRGFTPFDARELEASIPDRFERVVQRDPGALAVESPVQRLRYVELNDVANRIAHAILERRGEGPEPVALLLGQGALLIAAILGVLKAGKIYVPLEARHPRARLRHIVEDAGPRIFVCDERHGALARALAPSATILEADGLDEGVSSDDPRLALPPDALACIYYTSGSTGAPKGVVDSHRNVLHNVMRYTNGLRVSPDDRLSLIQSCSFSGCVSTQFAALLNGAALFPFDLQGEGPVRLAAWMHAQRLTMFHAVPALFRALVEAAGRLPDVRLVRLEGDRATWADVASFQAACGRGSQLVNGLGTTETGIVRRFFVDHQARIESGALPLGYPVEDMDVVLLDADGREVPQGEPGEIAVRSQYLATGYWRQPELSARAFVPAGDGSVARTYRTGDLGRLRADGCLEFVGRKDFQAKVRGQRVEVDAVERALLATGAFRHVVVTTREDHGRSPRLVAYLVPASASPPGASALRRALESVLPDASIPSAFMLLPSLPLADTGKVDWRALPPPGRERPRLDTTFVPPRTPIEARIAAIWAEVLELDEVGAEDRFLDLGGDSLLATRVQIRLRSSLGVELPLAALFDAPTVVDLARLVERAGPEVGRPAPGTAIPSRHRGEPIPLSFAQQRVWLLQQLDPDEPAYNEPGAVRLRGRLDQVALEEALAASVERHQALRLRVHAEDGAPMQQFVAPPAAMLEVIDLRHVDPIPREEEAQRVLIARARDRFDLAREPPIRATLLRLEDDDHVLLLVVHHIACDAWSLGHLWRELSSLYHSCATGQDRRVPPLPVTFADYVLWERERLGERRVTAQVDYWARQLAQLPAEPPVPFAPTDAATGSTRGSTWRTSLPPDLTSRVEAFATAEGATLFMVLLAAFDVLVARMSGRDDIVIGSPVAGRAHADAEPLIGCFVNTVVLRTDLSGDPTFREVVRRVRRSTLAAYSHQEAPFDLVVERVRGSRLGPRRSLFRTAFSLQNVPSGAIGFPGLDTTPVAVSTRCTKIDFAISARPGPGGIEVIAEYREDLFAQDAVRDLVEEWTRVLDAAVRDPDTPTAATGTSPDTGPETVERFLVARWKDELRGRHVGPEDAFLDLGGHSLAATRLINRIHEAYGTAVTHREFFDAATPRRLAALVWSRRTLAASPPLLPPSDLAEPAATSLTPAQEEVWAAADLHEGLPVYNEPFAIRFGSPISPQALEDALNHLIARHDVLRSGFVIDDAGRPNRIVHDHARLRLDVMDAPPGDAGEATLRAAGTALARQPFDLARPPLLRALLASRAGEDTRLYLIVHHLVIDAVGLYSVLVPELWSAHAAFVRGETPALAPLPFTSREASRRGGQALPERVRARQLEYWRAQLSGARPIDLPTDFIRPRAPTGHGAYLSFVIPPPLVAAVSELARTEGATLYNTLLAAFAALLHRWSGGDDLVIGTFDAGRTARDVEPLLGCFLRTLAIRLDARDDPLFPTWLAHVRDTCLEALANADVPFADVSRGLSDQCGRRPPLLRAAFVMEPSAPDVGGDWTLTQHELQTGTAKFDLTMEVEERREGLVSRLEYSTDLFQETTIASLVEAWSTLLESIIGNPRRRLSRLNLLSASQRQRVLVEFNDTRRPLEDLGVHELFERQAAATPDALAVTSGAKTLSYSELDSRAARLAAKLTTLGLAPEACVAVHGPRSIGFVVSVLAVLKAGGAYVPIDPAFPVTRKVFMLRDSGADVILTTGGDLDVAVAAGRTVIAAETERVLAAQPVSGSPPPAEPRPGRGDRIACVMYTSGTTGVPKGVLVTHRGIVRLVHGAGYVPRDHRQRFLLHSSIAFDASTFELWVPLLSGATCVVLEEAHPTLHDLEACLLQDGVSCLWLTSTLFNTVIDHRPRILDGVQHLLTGGEALSVAHVRRALERFPEMRLLNGYGPTEGTTFTCVGEVPRTLPPATRSVPLGPPVANTQVFVLDGALEPVPIGFPGELCIGGDGLARGYLNQPDLTAERFVAHPFSRVPGERLYRTGDLARWRADGRLEFLGRLDRQVKVRGFRVEPAEIETVLARHPLVRQCAVEAVGEGADRALVGFVVPDGPTPPSPADLRGFLAEQLPEYMIPTRWHALEALPTSASGKVARERLVAELPGVGTSPAHGVLPADAPQVSSRTMTRVAEAMAGVLGLAVPPSDADFFALGGHSLAASVLAARLRTIFDIDVPLRQVFDAPTPAGLASWIDARVAGPRTATASNARAGSDRGVTLVDIRRGSRSPALFFTYSLLGDAFACRPLFAALPPDHALYAFEQDERDPADADSVEAMAEACVRVLVDLAPPTPFCVAGYSFGGLTAFEIARQWVARGGTPPLVVILDTGPAPRDRGVVDVVRQVPLVLGNLPSWVRYTILQSDRRAIAAQVRRKLRIIGRRIRAGRLRPSGPAATEAEDIFTLTTLAPDIRANVQRRLDAANRYVPMPYPGRIVLFRSRARPLFHALEWDLGWKAVARGGVDIEVVPGNHVTLLHDSHAGALGARLARLLEAAAGQRGG